MTLKPCPNCKKPQTTKTAIKKCWKRDKRDVCIYFDCASCRSTFVLRAKNWKELLSKGGTV